MNVALLLYHDVMPLDVVGVHAVFRTAMQYTEMPIEVFNLGRTRSSIQGTGKVVMTPNYAFTASAPLPDVLIVPGGPGAERLGRDTVTRTYLLEQAARVGLLASVSTGALVLGELGLLENLRVTTWHERLDGLWDYRPADVLRARVVKNHEPARYFAGDPAAGLDLALEIVRDLIGLDVAFQTAAHLGVLWTPIEA